MRLALCQRRSVPNEVHDNLDSILSDIESTDADVYIYPELFLTGYFFDKDVVVSELDMALRRLSEVSKEKDVLIIVGAPEFVGDTVYNCAYALHSGMRIPYRKIHLPNFGPFNEKDRFTPGSGPIVFGYKGFRFGLSICYDLFFPELMKSCSLYGMADINVCISASPVTSRTPFERVLPARAVENTTYVAYVNNIDKMEDMEFFGGSRLLAPNGDELGVTYEPGIMTFELDRKDIENARKMRPVIKDTVFETVLH